MFIEIPFGQVLKKPQQSCQPKIQCAAFVDLMYG